MASKIRSLNKSSSQPCTFFANQCRTSRMHTIDAMLLSHDFTMATLSACALYDKIAYQTTPTHKMRWPNPPLPSCHDKTKLAWHRPACYKMEWIYTRTKVSGQGSLELVLENRKRKERKKERMTNCYFFIQLVQAYLIISMDVWGLDRWYRLWICKLTWKILKFKLLWVIINVFIMYYIYGISGPSLYL